MDAYTNTCQQNYKFTGKERDPESGLDNFEARYYGSSIARFTSPDDPFVGWNLADPQSLNLYAYVQDNPINGVDPTGHMTSVCFTAGKSPTTTSFAASGACGHATNPMDPASDEEDGQTAYVTNADKGDPLSAGRANNIEADEHVALHNEAVDIALDKVKVSTVTGQNPTAVQNQPIKGPNGQVTEWTGILATLVDTVTVNGIPTRGVEVSEANQEANTENLQPAPTILNQGNSTTNADGQSGDVISILHPTHGTRAENNQINQDFKTNTWISIDSQSMILMLPTGQFYIATSIRTLSNVGGSGYKLRYTQPVVTGPF